MTLNLTIKKMKIWKKVLMPQIKNKKNEKYKSNKTRFFPYKISRSGSRINKADFRRLATIKTIGVYSTIVSIFTFVLVSINSIDTGPFTIYKWYKEFFRVFYSMHKQ